MIESSTKEVDVYVSASVRKVDVIGRLEVHIHVETWDQLTDMCNTGVVDVTWNGKTCGK